MEFHPADGLSVIFFSFFSALMFAVIAGAVWRTRYKEKRFLVLFGGYLLAFCGVVQSGLPLRHVVPVIPLLFLSVIAAAFAFSFSQYGRKISQFYSLAAITGFQVFRLPLELILHHWAEGGTIPGTMTWTGQNWDIATGILSLLALPLVGRSKAVAWAVQVIGFLLLMNVVRVVLMSSPFPFSWPLENPLQLMAHLPYALIGPLFVGAALTGHIIAFRKLSQ